MISRKKENNSPKKPLEANPISSKEMKQHLKQNLGLERKLFEEYAKSKKRSHIAAVAGFVFGVLGITGGILGLSQDAPPPLVLRVDNATGAVDQITAVKIDEQSYGEVVDSYWLNQFVLNRESYEYHTIQQNYETTALLSSPEVQKEYYAVYSGEDARDVVLSNRARIRVAIKSIQTNDQGQATVRFTTTEERDSGRATVENWIATIGYRYVQVPMSKFDRLVNPLGFQVTSYRADPELIR